MNPESVREVPLLVTSDWLEQHLGDPGVRVVDTRWSLLDPAMGRAVYGEGHIPGAVFVDVDTELAAPRGEGPGRHPLPRPDVFAVAMARAGVGPATHVIACDFGDGSIAARLWWLLRFFGHDRVSLLDGGMKRWTAEGRPVEATVPTYAPGAFVPDPRPDRIVDAVAVEVLRSDPRTLILDARMAERYEGRTEPIDPVAAHIPGAVNRPYPSNVRSADDPRFLDSAVLRRQFAALGADRARSVVCYCGSGINACHNVFALELAGLPGALLYEGSWSDWCSVPERATKTGAEP